MTQTQALLVSMFLTTAQYHLSHMNPLFHLNVASSYCLLLFAFCYKSLWNIFPLSATHSFFNLVTWLSSPSFLGVYLLVKYCVCHIPCRLFSSEEVKILCFVFTLRSALLTLKSWLIWFCL